ncbi:unnamed protein product [marine sediment metagenome]|uniref:Phage tail collar domain-containing protein n=1 Tax=marine sediment metagenome TaxID=412755 RepID=X1CDM8_9ZZZZ
MGDGYNRHTPLLTGVKVVRAMSLDVALLPHVGEVIGNLSQDWIWLEVGDVVSDVVEECHDIVDSWYAPMNIGQVSTFLGSLPDGWLPLAGGTYDADLYPELFVALDSQFKDVPSNEFTLPDLGGLFPLSSGDGYVLGDSDGAVSVSLAIDEIPAHTHNYSLPVQGPTIGGAGPPLPAVNAIVPNTPTSSAGSGNAHENMPPYITLNYGVFSGRI